MTVDDEYNEALIWDGRPYCVAEIYISNTIILFDHCYFTKDPKTYKTFKFSVSNHFLTYKKPQTVMETET